MPDLTVTTECVRRGLHRIVGIVCGGDKIYGPCGGTLYVERVAAHKRCFGPGDNSNFKWETYCDKCKTCDCNGWATLAECVREAPAYFEAKGEPCPT